MSLTTRQKLFIQEYLVDLNATQAAIRAGYSEKSAKEIGSENLSKPNIAAEIQAAMNERSKQTKVTAEYVLNTIRETVDRCRQVEPVLDRKGDQVYCEGPNGDLVPAYTFQAQAVLKGCELLGRHLKLFVDKVEHTGKDGEDLFENITDTDLARKVAFILTKPAENKEVH